MPKARWKAFPSGRRLVACRLCGAQRRRPTPRDDVLNARQIGLPGWMQPPRCDLENAVVHRHARALRCARKAHIGATRCSAPLKEITATTCRNEIPPVPRTPKSPWNNMVDGGIGRRRTAVLAGVLITDEYLSATQLRHRPRSPDLVQHPDDRRPREVLAVGLNSVCVPFEDLSLPLGKQHDCASRDAHVQRLVVLIEKKNRSGHVARDVSRCRPMLHVESGAASHGAEPDVRT